MKTWKFIRNVNNAKRAFKRKVRRGEVKPNALTHIAITKSIPMIVRRERVARRQARSAVKKLLYG